MNISLEQLATKLGLTKSKITNHFPSRDDLFVAISKDYDVKFSELVASFNWKEETTFQQLADNISKIMDLQYEYRSVIIYIASNSHYKASLRDRVSECYDINIKGIQRLIKCSKYRAGNYSRWGHGNTLAQQRSPSTLEISYYDFIKILVKVVELQTYKCKSE